MRLAKISKLKGQNWLGARKTLADILIQTPRLEVDSLVEQLNNLLIDDELDNSWHEFAKQEPIKQYFSKTEQVSAAVQNKINLTSSTQNSNLLILLPLSIFLGDNRRLFTEIITQCNLKSVITTEAKEDILIWSYLLTLSLNNQFETQGLNLSLIIKQVLSGVAVETTALVKKLELVSWAWEKGLGLHQLSEELFAQGNPKQIAIALSCYCFASTPQDFRLSVQRAASLDQNIAELTIALTGSLSGAYNGIAGIPWSWRAIANHNQSYLQVQQQGRELIKTWLGIFSLENNQYLYDQEIHAAAPTNLIQLRKSLKIISQKS